MDHGWNSAAHSCLSYSLARIKSAGVDFFLGLEQAEGRRDKHSVGGTDLSCRTLSADNNIGVTWRRLGGHDRLRFWLPGADEIFKPNPTGHCNKTFSHFF